MTEDQWNVFEDEKMQEWMHNKQSIPMLGGYYYYPLLDYEKIEIDINIPECGNIYKEHYGQTRS